MLSKLTNNAVQSSEAQRVAGLSALFDATFVDYNTRLICGDDEPIYRPADTHTDYHQIVFAHGFFNSALHEIAHWCIAGEKRRQLVDYGYWYCPDGRDANQQFEFEQVEIKPQAIEWAFSVACGRMFRVSTDNLNGAEPDRQYFVERVLQQLSVYLEQGFPARAQRFIHACQNTYATQALSLAACIAASKDKL